MKTTKRIRRDARRLYRACLVNGLLDDDRARQVVQRVAAARRRGSLAFLSYFEWLVKLDRERHSAVVESAAPLAPDLTARVEAGITNTYGPGTSTSFLEKPSLIGGMRVKIGSDVYDGTVRTALARLKERF